MLDNFISKSIFNESFLRPTINLIYEKDKEILKKEKELKNKNKLNNEELKFILNDKLYKSIFEERLEKLKYIKAYEKLVKKCENIKNENISITEKEIKLQELRKKIEVFRTKIKQKISLNYENVKKLYNLNLDYLREINDISLLNQLNNIEPNNSN